MQTIVREDFHTFMHRERGLAARTVEAYEWWLDRWEAWCLDNGRTPMSATPRDVRDFSLSSDTWGRKTRSQCLSSLKAFYRWAELEGLVDRDPARAVHHPKVFVRLAERYEPREAVKLWEAAGTSYLGLESPGQLIVGLGLFTGLRPGEVTGLRAEDVSFKRSVVVVRRSSRYAEATKSGRDREVPMHRLLRDPLRMASRLAESQDGFLLGIQTPQGSRDRLVRICQQAGVRYLPPHALRRTFAVRLRQQKVREGVVRALLGHAPRVEDLYMQTDRPELVEAINRLRYS